MLTNRFRRSACVLCGMALTLASGVALAAHANFKESDVDVLYGLSQEQAGDGFGWVADPIGDIDGDGTPDFITSAPFWVNGSGQAVGKYYVFSGADGSLLFSEQGVAGEYLGYSATAAGDVDDDGVPDYIVGSLARAIVRSGADHSLIHEWAMQGEYFGFDSAGIGDANGDGYDDVVVGAPLAGYGGAGSGRLYVFSGDNGEILWTFDGEAGWLTGVGTGPAGDLNGDGTPDVVVAAHGAVKSKKGAVFALSGDDGGVLLQLKSRSPSPGTLTAKHPYQTTFGRYHCHGVGDVDADGVPDIYVGDYGAKSPEPTGDEDDPGFYTGRAYVFSGADGSLLRDIRAENVGDGMGPGRLVADVNGDGHDDIYAAAYLYTDGPLSQVGKGYLISGQDGSVLRTMTGQTAGESLGVDALSLGDVSGDGVTDYALTGAGSLWVILGN
ncbi:MAG: FG-GAP-like repeat-containing protein [Lysobacterales bacterium]|jgi:hypothetical protein